MAYQGDRDVHAGVGSVKTHRLLLTTPPQLQRRDAVRLQRGALAGALFTTMLQLSLVCERWPLNGFSPLKSGVAGLALSWAVGVGAYFLFVNVGFVPAAVRAAAGLHNPGGPVSALDFGIALIVVGVWQTVFFVVL